MPTLSLCVSFRTGVRLMIPHSTTPHHPNFRHAVIISHRSGININTSGPPRGSVVCLLMRQTPTETRLNLILILWWQLIYIGYATLWHAYENDWVGSSSKDGAWQSDSTTWHMQCSRRGMSSRGSLTSFPVVPVDRGPAASDD